MTTTTTTTTMMFFFHFISLFWKNNSTKWNSGGWTKMENCRRLFQWCRAWWNEQRHRGRPRPSIGPSTRRLFIHFTDRYAIDYFYFYFYYVHKIRRRRRRRKKMRTTTDRRWNSFGKEKKKRNKVKGTALHCTTRHDTVPNRHVTSASYSDGIDLWCPSSSSSSSFYSFILSITL